MNKGINILWGKISGRIWTLLLLLSATVCMQFIPDAGDFYTSHLYPCVVQTLGRISQLCPFAMGDLCIALCIAWLCTYPFYARLRKNMNRKSILLHEIEFLLWIYVWFYWIWGLNYAQSDFYKRAGIPHADYEETDFNHFATAYVDSLNACYTTLTDINREDICREAANSYNGLPGIHALFLQYPKAKTMLFTTLASQVGVLGSMEPFFCEFTLNGDLLPSQYPATYTHELAHFQGIARESEANFYAYLACTRSHVQGIRFSGYLAILPHVLSNAARLMDEETFRLLAARIRPEVVSLVQANRQYWAKKYSPSIGKVQNLLYDLFLKGNRVSGGRNNYSEVIGLLIAYEQHLRTSSNQP